MTTIMLDRTLKFKEVVTLWDALEMRGFRNECREYMTHDTSWISIWRQVWWYYKTYKQWRKGKRAVAYLAYYQITYYQVTYYQVPVGYGVIRNLKTKPLLSGGLSGKYRGMGFGEQLFAFLVKQAGKKIVALDVREDNIPAIRLYKKLGFKQTKKEAGIIYMQYGHKN